MITAKEDSFEELGWGLQPHIENLIWNSSLDDRTKDRLMTQMLALRSNEEAQGMITLLGDCQMIPGLERTPLTLYEIVKATRDRADRDDFSEQRWK